MNVFVQEIPFIESLLVLAILGLGSLGFFHLLRKNDPSNSMLLGSVGKWILVGLTGLAVLSFVLLFIMSLVLV